MSETIRARVQLRTDTSAAWAAENPVLLRGEGGYEWDTGRLRIGDGVTPFMSLPHQGTPFVGPVEPAGAAAGGMLWLDTSVSPAVLRQRSADNTAWLRVAPELPLAVGQGGTGATTAAAARTALGAAAVADLPPALSLAQVQNPASTEQGTVSGQLLAQASQSLANGAAGWPRITPAALDRPYVLRGGGASLITLGWDSSGLVSAVDQSFLGTVHVSSLGWGAIGTYAIFYNRGAFIPVNSLCPGSQLLRESNSFSSPRRGSIPGSNVNFGTWRAMNDVNAAIAHNPPDDPGSMFPGLFLRVS